MSFVVLFSVGLFHMNAVLWPICSYTKYTPGKTYQAHTMHSPGNNLHHHNDTPKPSPHHNPEPSLTVALEQRSTFKQTLEKATTPQNALTQKTNKHVFFCKTTKPHLWPGWRLWERGKATCWIHSTAVFIQGNLEEKKEAWQMLLLLLRNNFFPLGWEKCARQLSHPPTGEMGRFWQAVWPAESSLDGPWLGQMECIYDLPGFASRVMTVIPHLSGEFCAWKPVRGSESLVESVSVFQSHWRCSWVTRLNISLKCNI